MKSILNNTAKQLMNVANKAPAAVNYFQSLNPQEFFDVVMTDEAKKLYKKGILVFKERSDGLGLMPTLVNAKKRFGKQIALEKKLIAPEKMSALNNLVVQQELAQIINLLEEMNENLNDILQGQQNDRVALFYSAQQQYLEAITVESPELKSIFLANVIKTANDARFQLIETAKHDIDRIIKMPTSGIEIITEHNKNKKATNEIINIRIAFKIINDATGICAATYSEIGERNALLKCLEPYKKFIEDNIQEIDGKKGTSAFWHLQLNDKNNDNMWVNKPTLILKQIVKLSDTCKKIDLGEIMIYFPDSKIIKE